LKVAYFTGLRRLELADAPEPRLDDPGSVLLRIERVGVCGSDVHYYVHGGIGRQKIEYPATMGHECSGTVVEVGSAVTDFRPGMRVAVDPATVCGQCDQCRAGRINTCRKIQFMGCPGQSPGAVAEFRVVPSENCFPLPEGMSLDDGALVEPLSIGLYAARLGELRPAAPLAILGAGPIGLGVLLCAKAAAPCMAYVTDLLDERLAVARRSGADWTANARTAAVVESILAEQPLGLDVVFECSGDPECIDQAQELLAPGGTLVIVGIPPVLQVSFDAHLMRTKELSFKNVRRQRGCIEPVMRMIAEGRIDPAPMLTHRFPLGRIQEAFELVAAYADGVVKAMIDLPGFPPPRPSGSSDGR
jgi:L-iditol 2-dehydrogenase